MLSKFSLVHFVVFMAAFSINSGAETKEKSSPDSVLLRKRRYLMFPEGSSFQLVFCLTYTSVGVGSYFVFGHTAAIAWQLPSEPLYFDQRDFRKKEDDAVETTTTQMSQGDKNLPYSRINEQARRRTGLVSVYYYNPFEAFMGNPRPLPPSSPKSFSRGNQETFQSRRYNEKSHMRLDMDPKYYQVHRRSRRELYVKIEAFLTRLNVDGKSCLLKTICEVHKLSHEKGQLLEEMFKAVFRAKAHDKHGDEDEYDVAANLGHNCDQVYPTCQGSIRNIHLFIKK